MKCKKCERSVPIWAKADENMCAEHSYERLNEENKRLKEELELHRDYESFLQGRDHNLPMPSYTSWFIAKKKTEQALKGDVK